MYNVNEIEKEEYESPETKIIKFTTEDVISTSGEFGDIGGGEGGNPF